MRCSTRNHQLVHYARYEGTSITTDEWGNETGESVNHEDPVPLYVNVSAAKNAEFADVFGINIDYDRVLILPVRNFDIDEHSVLWIDANPATEPFDYIVRRVSRSVNATAVAVKRVDVQHGN